MFDKKNDVCLKIVNGILLIIMVISLGLAIGNNYYYSNLSMYCAYSKYDLNINDYEQKAEADCRYASSISEVKSEKMMCIGYSLFATSTAGLIVVNLFKKKDK